MPAWTRWKTGPWGDVRGTLSFLLAEDLVDIDVGDLLISVGGWPFGIARAAEGSTASVPRSGFPTIAPSVPIGNVPFGPGSRVRRLGEVAPQGRLGSGRVVERGLGEDRGLI
jgi:hypothetical protein